MTKLTTILGIMILSIILLTGLASANTCSQSISSCSGSLPDSTLGYGAAEICGTCYLCGVADGICPEDFYEGGNVNLQGNCSLCPDPDCGSNVYVRVKGPGGSPATGVDIDVIYQEHTVPSIPTQQTGLQGDINISAYSGEVQVIAHQSNMATQSQTVNLIRGETTNIVFTNFTAAPCQADNTRGDGFCHKDCYGEKPFTVNETGGYTALDVATQCNNMPSGSRIMLGQEENHYYSTGCCVGDITETIRPIININDYQKEESKITNLLTHVQGIFYNSEKIFMVATIIQSK